MAWLRKLISKNTYMTIAGLWSATSVYITLHFNLSPETITFIVTAGNLIIAWLGVESGRKAEQQTANS